MVVKVEWSLWWGDKRGRRYRRLNCEDGEYVSVGG